jgi:hypothetical protein
LHGGGPLHLVLRVQAKKLQEAKDDVLLERRIELGTLAEQRRRAEVPSSIAGRTSDSKFSDKYVMMGNQAITTPIEMPKYITPGQSHDLHSSSERT